MSVFLLSKSSYNFPNTYLANNDGLLAVGGDLSPKRLILAYSLGIFPWYNEDPILWWSPAPRCAILPSNLHIPRSLDKTFKKGTYSLTMDVAFDQVISNCAFSRKNNTWINSDIIYAYNELFKLNIAHSVEVWREGNLVGGLYGIALGSIFFGESMFFIEPNTSKLAFAYLAKQLVDAGFLLIDCQQETEHMKRFGATLLSRNEFENILKKGVALNGHYYKWTKGFINDFN